MNESQLKRRQILKALGCVLPLVTLSSCGGNQSSGSQAGWSGFFQTLKVDRALLRQVVDRCAISNEQPIEPDFETTAFAENVLPTNEVDLKRYLRKQIAADFEEGRTIKVDGWILSKSEVSVWMLYSSLE